MKKTLLILIAIIATSYAYAQNDSIPAVKVIARALPDKVILRWAITTPVAWQQANKYGYTVERVLMTKNNKLVKNRKIEQLQGGFVKLLPEDEWESVARDEKGNIDKYAAIAAQAIFGDSFELTEDYSNNITKVIQKAEENEKRFTFALYAADKSLKVAKAMGLMFTDTTVLPDERYLYRIYANVPHEIMKIDTGFVYTGPPDYAPLPKPMELQGDFDDHYVTLTWNRELFENIYTDYIVERSDDGKEFYPIDDLPFLNTAPDDKRIPRLMYRMDSLPLNNHTYYYRIRGRTPFDETGPWSDTISGQAFAALKYRPANIAAEVIDNKKVQLTWDFPDEHNEEIEYFSIYRAPKSNGTYTEIAGNLNPDVRTYTDEKPSASNYYIIRVFDANKKSGSSFPVFAQLVDSFPPAKPFPPKAFIDSAGNVTIYWQKSPEEDVIGYRVFRSNFMNEEFGQQTHKAIPDTFFTEKINLKTLSKKIYYKIAAVDYNFNQSELSDAVVLLKPDTIIPVPPLLKKVQSAFAGVEIEWINSSSKDVVKQILYRRKAGDEKWLTLAVFPMADSINSFTDTSLIPKALHEYTMIAVDESGNESMPCKSVFARKIDSGIRPPLKKIHTNIDREQKLIEIFWEYPYTDIKHFLIYRAEETQAMSYYKLILPENNKFTDKRISINTNYRYRIKAVFADGSESAFSKEINVKF